MRQRTERHQGAADRTLKDIRRKTRKRYSSEEKIRIVLAGLAGRGQHCRVVPPEVHKNTVLFLLVLRAFFWHVNN